MLFNKYYENCYEELIRYYPRFYREVFEMDAILKAHGKLADDMESNIERVLNNGFIDTADEYTVKRLEEFFYLEVGVGNKLSERRNYIKSFLIGCGKISASLICAMVKMCTGMEVECKFEPFDSEGNNRLDIKITQDEKSTLPLNNVITILSRRIPAHIYWLLNNTILLNFDLSSIEKVKLAKIRLHFFIIYFVCKNFDGSLFWDGSHFMNYRMRYDLKLKNHIKMCVYTQNIVTPIKVKFEGYVVDNLEEIKGEVIEKKNYYFNGNVLFDGSINFGLNKKKEEL